MKLLLSILVDESIKHKFVGYSNRGEFLHLLKEEGAKK